MSEKAIKEESSINLDSAFVKEDDRVLDPTLIDKSILERMPQPTGWRMLVLPYKGKGMTEGGIQLVKETIERESLATVVAYVVAMGPDCYKDLKGLKNLGVKKNNGFLLAGMQELGLN